jgi:ATP-dependent exoDNAse (exonuclease V) alpha subunit
MPSSSFRITSDPTANLLMVEKANHELATYDPRRLTGVSVYREIGRDFSVGDRIQFTAPDKSLGVANHDLAIIEFIAPNGWITARVDNDRQIKFNASAYRHFDHGYAVTSHSSQASPPTECLFTPIPVSLLWSGPE